MQKLKKVLLREETLIGAFVVLIVIIALTMAFYARNLSRNQIGVSDQSCAHNQAGTLNSTNQTKTLSSNAPAKTLIIFAEAFPYYVVSKNLDYLPNVKALCNEGRCFSMQPQSPTFTTMELYALQTGRKPYEAQYAYNFIINETAYRQNTCSFDGSFDDLGWPAQTNLLGEISATHKFASYSFARADHQRYSEDLFPKIPDLLEKSDVVFTYITDTDSHYTNLTTTDSQSPLMAKFKLFDQQLGILFQHLKARGLYENTNIVLFGDHGMMKIEHFDYLPELLGNASKNADLNDVCVWNDAGMSLRFWILSKAAEKKGSINKALTDYFSSKSDCYEVVNDAVLRQYEMYFPNATNRWINFGDVYIATKPGCKVNTQKPAGGMENGFADVQSSVDKYISMHGYIDNNDPKLQAFVIARVGAATEKPIIPENFTARDLHGLIKDLVFGHKNLVRSEFNTTANTVRLPNDE